MEQTQQFSGKAEMYSRFRPSYPEEYVDDLIRRSGVSVDSLIADIGAGTGILTAQLIDRGLHVVAVEPNADMRNSAAQALGDSRRCTIINGTAEDTGIAPHSVDLITVAQAFHWFDHVRFKAECRRILREDRYVVLVWNSRDAGSELVQANAELCKRLCPAFKGFSGGIEDNPEVYADFFRDGEFDFQVFANPLQMDREGFVGRNLSASYAPKPSDEHYETFVRAVNALFDTYSCEGLLTMPNLTRSYMGRV